MGFNDIKTRVITALNNGAYRHEQRNDINVKNLLAMGVVTATEVVDVLKRCRSQHCETSPHHDDQSIDVHVFKHDSWYVKFYFFDPDTVFISVHE